MGDSLKLPYISKLAGSLTIWKAGSASLKWDAQFRINAFGGLTGS